jgi:hypothetical protein
MTNSELKMNQNFFPNDKIPDYVQRLENISQLHTKNETLYGYREYITICFGLIRLLHTNYVPGPGSYTLRITTSDSIYGAFLRINL